MKEVRPLINLGIKSTKNRRDLMMIKCPFCGREFTVFTFQFSFPCSRRECLCGALLGEPNCIKETENDIKRP